MKKRRERRSTYSCYGSFLVITFVVALLVLLGAVNAAVPIDTSSSINNSNFSNGGFETGNFSGWEVWGDPNDCSKDTICQPVWCDVLTNTTCIVRSMSIDITHDPFTDNYSAVLGHYEKDPYTFLYSKIDLRQNLNLTKGNTTLSLNTKVFSQNIGVNKSVYDYNIIVNDGTEHIIWSLSDTSSSTAPLKNWTLLTFNLSEYSGKNITLIFRFMQDFCCGNGKQWDLIWSGTSLWYLDNIEITNTTSSGRVHNINKRTDYLSIQAAIDNASSGDGIYVDSDIYYENVNVSKQLFLKGINTGAGNPVVDAGGSGNVITLSAGNSTLEGFEVVGSSWLDAGILISSNDNFIRNNYVSNNYKGISLDESSHSNTLIGNNVSNNAIFGIFLGGSRNNTLRDNNISKSNTYGLYLGNSFDNTIEGNYILNNHFIGVYLDSSSSNNILKDNHVYNNTGGGITLRDSSSSNNMLIGNNVSNNKGDGISIFGSINNILMANNVLNNSVFGISLWGSSSIMLTRNNVLDNNGTGIYLRGSKSNTLNDNNVFKNNIAGISLGTDSSNNTLRDNNVLNNTGDGISLWYYSDNNTINDNIVSNNLNDGISLIDYSNNNIIYNNYFNNINNYKILNSSNIWNITKINNTNIILGPFMGGNIWANPNGTGFSQTCDNNIDEICDSTYSFDNNSDYLPLTYLLDQALSPSFSVSPSIVLPDQLFNVELIINNNHFETINEVKPLLLIGTLEDNASPHMISGPVPGYADISGRSSQVYTWTCKASGTGKLALSGSASGVDVVSGKTVPSFTVYKNVPVVLREGGVSISVLPRTNTILNGTSIILDIKAKNTQNIDDVFKIQINVSEIPLSYQADPGWFNWTEQIVYLRAGQEIISPINITIPDTISVTKLFRAKVSQETSGIYAYDTGYLKIT